MSPEQENLAGGPAGDASDEELRRILGDDYEGAMGKDKAASGAAAPAEEEAMPDRTGLAGGDDLLPSPNMTAEEAEKWARQMAEELEDTPAGAPPPVVPPGLFAQEPRMAPPPMPAPAPAENPAVQAVHFGQLDEGGGHHGASMEMLLDVKLPISVELGRTEMLVKEILDCGPGTVIELNKLAGEPVDVFINGRIVAQGEVVVVDEHFGVRVTALLSPRERVRSLA
jgi:flagellar motor switch protein FliN